MPSAAIPTVTTGPSFAAVLQGLASLRKRMRRLTAAWFREAQSGPAPTRLQRDDLMAMSSHELKDLGIGRSEIPALLGEPSSWKSSRH